MTRHRSKGWSNYQLPRLHFLVALKIRSQRFKRLSICWKNTSASFFVCSAIGKNQSTHFSRTCLTQKMTQLIVFGEEASFASKSVRGQRSSVSTSSLSSPSSSSSSPSSSSPSSSSELSDILLFFRLKIKFSKVENRSGHFYFAVTLKALGPMF